MMRAALAFALSLSLLGCAGVKRTWRPEAFGPRRTMAVVSIDYDPRLLPMLDRDEVPYRQEDAKVVRGSARGIFGDTMPCVLDALAKTELFVLLPEERVVPALPRELFVTNPTNLETAPGYPPPRPARELAPVARELGVDGVVSLGMFFGYYAILLDYGFDAVGTIHGQVVYSVAAFDGGGRMVWRDVVSGRSRGSLWSRWSTLEGDRLFPLLQEAAAEATDRLVSRLREHVQR